MPLSTEYTTGGVQARLSKHTKILPDGCHIWTGSKDRKGYGQLRIDKKLFYAHRIAWELVNGPIPDGMYACHICDNPACCNPSHIFIGTQSDNMRDASVKGRSAKGQEITCAKLTEDDVRDIRLAYSRGERQWSIAKRYGSNNHKIVSDIVTGKTWKHVV